MLSLGPAASAGVPVVSASETASQDRDPEQMAEVHVDIRKFLQLLAGQQVNPTKAVCSECAPGLVCRSQILSRLWSPRRCVVSSRHGSRVPWPLVFPGVCVFPGSEVLEAGPRCLSRPHTWSAPRESRWECVLTVLSCQPDLMSAEP